MKDKDTQLTYSNFNNRKFVREFKKKSESSLISCKLKLIGNDKEAELNYQVIYKLIVNIVRNPIVYANEMIYIAIIEITSYVDFIDLFKESVKNVRSEDGLKDRHKKLFEKQKTLISHLREISENPEQAPSFIKDHI